MSTSCSKRSSSSNKFAAGSQAAAFGESVRQLREEATAVELASPPEPRRESALGQALQHQNEVEKTLSELLSRLEPWSSTREVRGEARTLLQDQRQQKE